MAEARSKPRHYPPNYKNRYYTEVQQPVPTLLREQRTFLQTTYRFDCLKFECIAET